jgi:EpsI family protein
VVSTANLVSLPSDIGSWSKSAPDSLIEKDVLDGWGVTSQNFLMREYTNPDGDHVSLMLIYKGLDRRGWHLSEMCFSGSGYNVDQSTSTVPYAGADASAVKLVAEDIQQGTTVVSVYWFAQGSRTESDFVKMQTSMALARLNPPKDGWAFIRVTSNVTSSADDSMRQIRDFVKSASDPLIKSLTSAKPIQ